MIIGEEEIPNERALLTQEDGPMMASSASVKYIVIHCSATRSTRDYTAEQLLRDHKTLGFRTVGYHFYIRKNGDIKTTRPIEKIGAHARGYNAQSIGICYEGGISERGRPEDTRTVWQKHSLRVLVRALLVDYPGCKVCGHRDLSPDRNGNGEIEPEEWIKACPCFEVKAEFGASSHVED